MNHLSIVAKADLSQGLRDLGLVDVNGMCVFMPGITLTPLAQRDGSLSPKQ